MSSSQNAFVFYETFLDTIEMAEKVGLRQEMIDAIIDYGLFHKEPELTKENGMILMGLAQIKNAIDDAQVRHNKSVEDGAKGGRPVKKKINDLELVELISSGTSREEAAKLYGVSVRTIQRHLANAKEATVFVDGKPLAVGQEESLDEIL